MTRVSVFALFTFFAACDHTPAPTAPDAGSGPFAGSDAQYSAGPFTVQPGTSIVMCTFVQGTNAEDVDVQGFVATQSVGGHHLIVYTVDHAIDLPPSPCLQGGQPSWTQVVGTQSAEEIVAFPANVGFHVKAHQQFVMETHYINATPNVMTVQSAFALWYSPAGTVTLQAHPYFFGTLNIDIPPGQAWSAQSTCAPPDPVTFYAMQGHEHQMGTGVTVNLIPGDGGLPEGLDAGPEGGEAFLYATTIWDSPPYALFGNGAGIQLGPQDQIHVTCNWNNTGSAQLSYPQEMCFAVGFYWPGPGALFCLQGGGDSATCNCGYQGTLDTGPGGSTVTANVSVPRAGLAADRQRPGRRVLLRGRRRGGGTHRFHGHGSGDLLRRHARRLQRLLLRRHPRGRLPRGQGRPGVVPAGERHGGGGADNAGGGPAVGAGALTRCRVAWGLRNQFRSARGRPS